MLDIHTHILPDMDDGSKSLKQSITMLRREAKQGIDRIVVTPHFYAHRESPEHFLKRRHSAMQALLQKINEQDSLPEIITGAEVAFFRGVSRTDDIEKLCIGNTHNLLVEMPFSRWNRSVVDELIFLKECRGVRPVLAHIERYMQYQPLGTIRELCEAGIWMQVNASFFLKWQTSWLAMWMLKKRRIQFIGSDCHDTRIRPPNLGAAIALIEKKLGRGTVKYLNKMEQKLLKGG